MNILTFIINFKFDGESNLFNEYFKKLLKFIKSFRSIKYFNLDISIQQYLNNNKMVKKKVYDFNKFKYEPISLKSCQLIYEIVNKQLIDKQLNKNELYDNLNKIYNNLPSIFNQAERTCCIQIKSNGYYSYLKVVYKFFECINQQLNLNKNNDQFKKDLDYFTKTSHLLNRLTEIQTKLAQLTFLDDELVKKNLDNELDLKYPKFHKDLKMFKNIKLNKKTNGLQLNNNLDDDQFEFNSLPLFTPNLEFILESLTEAILQPNTKDKYVIYQDYFMYWLDESLVSFFKFYVFVLPFLRVRLYQYFHLIFSSKFRAQTLNKILSFPTVNFPFELWNFSDFKGSLLFVKYKTRNTKTKSKEVFIPTQTSIKINSSYENKITFNDLNEIKFTKNRKIRCKYIKPKNYDLINSNRLCLHMHGGGFFSQRCDSHEIYLRHWVNFNKIPILTIDYITKEPFPNGLQDCFDVYIWLRNAPEEEIRKKLGFYPKNIVLTGDSAGGNLSNGVALILNDLRTEFKSKFNVPIQMPNGLVLIYSPFLINTSVSPSRVLAPLDSLVPLGVQLIILYGISGKIPGLKPNNHFQAMMTYLFPNHDPQPWFDCTKEQFKERSDELSKLITSPYLTPLFYDKYDQFTDLPIHLISAEFCSFLDESITMAKLWKGPCKVDVIESMSHGFLNLKFAGKNVSNATMFCCQKVTEMFEYTEKNN